MKVLTENGENEGLVFLESIGVGDKSKSANPKYLSDYNLYQRVLHSDSM